jgi:hypothetical protein
VFWADHHFTSDDSAYCRALMIRMFSASYVAPPKGGGSRWQIW